MSTAEPTIDGWVILELMGHRRLAGYLSEAQVAGAGFLRLDVPGPAPADPPTATQLYNPTAVYGITYTTEDLARRAAQSNQPAPITPWELPPPAEPTCGGCGRLNSRCSCQDEGRRVEQDHADLAEYADHDEDEAPF